MAKLPKSARDMIPTGSAGVGVLERVKNLEKRQRDIMTGVSQAFASSDQRHSSTEEVLNAIIMIVGRDAVEAEVQRQTIERLESKSAKEKVALEEALKAGRCAPAEVVGDRSIVVGFEVDKEGNKLHPHRVQLLYQSLRPEYKERMKDRKVGDEFDTPPGTKFTVTEIYDIALNPPKETQEEPQANEEVPTEAAQKTEPVDEEVEARLVEELAAKADATQPTN